MTHTLLKKDSTPLELKVIKYLYPRLNLSPTQNLNYKNLYKGYEGERKVNDLLEKHLSSNYLIINDLLFHVNGTEFQIDTLLIGNEKIYLLEIKNYEGDYYIKNENWYSALSSNEIRNPLHQLKRSKLLLQRFLQRTEFHFAIESYILFINSEFYLYEAPLHLPVIFPTQVNRFIKKLHAISLKQTEHQQKLAQYLIDHRLSQSSHQQLPKYEYDELRKGIVCLSCYQFLAPFNNKNLICKNCGYKENIDSAVKRSISEWVTLFPNKKITTNSIHEWCRIIESKKTIRRILKIHLTPVGKGRSTHYTVQK